MFSAGPPAWAQAKISDAGGLVEGTRIIAVTQLGDGGPGSLRTALDQGGPRVVVFEVAGYIDLKSDLTIREGRVTIAGQTAPDPGIIIRGGGIAVRAPDVVIEHLAVYPGSSNDPAVAGNRDGISFYGSPSRKELLGNLVLRHVSVGWAVDENIGVQGLIDGLRIERSLIAEGLRRGGHAKGVHSMNVLLGNTVRSVELLGNVMASGNQRNPRLTQGNVVSMQNNFIYGFGAAATHIDSSKEVINGGAIDVIGNAYRPNPDSRCGQPIVRIASGFFAREPRTKVFVHDNIEIASARPCLKPVTDNADSAELDRAPVTPGAPWRLMPAVEVYPAILRHAGARPASRNPIDARIIAGIENGTGRLIDSEVTVGGWPALSQQTRALSLPVAMWKRLDSASVKQLSQWLCEAERTVSSADRACR